jgi:hypothetical protein
VKTPRTSYFRQIARQPTALPVVLHPPTQVLRRWEMAQRPVPAAAPVRNQKPESARTAEPLSSSRAPQKDQTPTAERPAITQSETAAIAAPVSSLQHPSPQPMARPEPFQAVLEEGSSRSQAEAAPRREKPRAVQYAPLTPPAPVLHPPPAAAPRAESASIEIGAIEIQIVPPPTPPPPLRPAPRRAPAPRSSLSRDFTTSFGLRQG